MRKRDWFSAWTVCWALLLALSPGLFAAAPPALIDYQGVLRSAADAPLSGAYDMTFRFFDAESGGNEILLDRHLASGAQAVAVDGGLFSVGLGGGTVSDGSGPGAYTSLGSVFRDYGEVWLEIEINSEVLAPRTRVLAGAYALNATSAQTADQLNGHSGSFYLDTSATRQTKFGTLLVESPDATFPAVQAIADAGSVGALSTTSSGATCKMSFGNNGIECYGNSFGGFFEDSTELSYAYIGTGPYGIYAASASVAGDFTSTGGVGIGVYGLGPTSGGQFRNSSSAAEAILGTGTYGVDAHGPTAGRFVQDLSTGSYTYVGYSGYGILSKTYNGIHSIDITDSSWSRIGNSPYKVQGTGSVSFVQNHPDNPREVVIYHAPESSEVNVYTRGSAKLVDGFARVDLDPTFAWTANPDIGLTAHLTPRGEPIALAVEAVGTRELLVRGPKGSDVAFDYWVTGLRIGFEEMPVVSPKEFESAIPARASGHETYAKNPGLRAFNALERHRAMSTALGRAVDPELKAAKELRARIGIGRPADSSDEPPAVASAPPPVAVPPSSPDDQGHSTRLANRRPDPVSEEIAGASKAEARTVELFVARSPIEAGDVVVLEPAIPGGVRRCDATADRKLVGVAVERDHDGRVAVAFAAIHDVLVDAGDHPIAVGDLLTTSATQGAATKATADEAGTILGKALEPLPSGLGTIRVLLMPR
jgi:hypothetical protein